jgi:hypothetical protein
MTTHPIARRPYPRGARGGIVRTVALAGLVLSVLFGSAPAAKADDDAVTVEVSIAPFGGPTPTTTGPPPTDEVVDPTASPIYPTGEASASPTPSRTPGGRDGALPFTGAHVAGTVLVALLLLTIGATLARTPARHRRQE